MNQILDFFRDFKWLKLYFSEAQLLFFFTFILL